MPPPHAHIAFQRREHTLQLVAAFLCERARASDESFPSPSPSFPSRSHAALCGMLGRVAQTAAEHRAMGGTHRAGVYAPRRGMAGGAIRHFSQRMREEVVEAAGAEMCLFKYDANPSSPKLGCPLEGQPHTLFLDPSGGDYKSSNGGTSTSSKHCREGRTGKPTTRQQQQTAEGADLTIGSIGLVLNQGKGLRPAEDARGWKWKEKLAHQRDGSLLYDGKAVARVLPNADGWTAG